MIDSRKTALSFLIIVAGLTTALKAQGTRSDYERAANLRKLTDNKVFKTKIEPHWNGTGDQFWYRNNLADGASEFVVVDATSTKRSLAFDHQRVADALSKATNKQQSATALPIKRIELSDEGLHFEALGKWWKWNAKSGEVEESPRPDPPKKEPARDGIGQQRQRSQPPRDWDASIKDFNVVLRHKPTGEQFELTQDGTAEHFYEQKFEWSPDKKTFVVLKTARAQQHTVHMIESAPKDKIQPKLHSHNYLKPGDRIALSKPCLFDVESRKKIEIDDKLFPNPWSINDVRWQADSRRFTFLYNQRGHQVLRVIAVDAETGEAGVLVDEQSKTFVDYAYKRFARYLDETHEMIWMSERDGWNHLYLYDLRTGDVKNQITKGHWVVRNVEDIDVKKRRIVFRACGIYPEQDLYYEHFCRIDFDGSNLVILTGGNGTHSIQYSPDREYFIDTYSRVDMPPVHELRDSCDGKLICELEKADASQLFAAGWKAPERFVAKGRDDKTDIHGVIWRPTNFDPEKKYPVIEKIYAGPHGYFVPKKFSSYYKAQSLAELGFIVVQIDGMGTNWRSKTFHDVCWKNLGDSGFPDRIKWIKAAAKKYSYMDISRVGIYGGSAGGQSSTRAMLAHGDFYKVAVSDCGCHDNRMDKIWWNEFWMGWPIGPHYEEQSNVTNAHKLTGKLLLTVGELDRNVDPASTMQVVDALIKADKDFDMLVVPGAGHGVGESPYGIRRRRDYFVRHLQGVEPRNSAGADDSRKYKLRFSGKEHVVISNLRYDGSHPITIEAIVSQPGGGSVVANFDTAGTGIDVVGNRWLFHFNDDRQGNNGYATIYSDETVERTKPVHVAGVFDGEKITLYVDGKLQRDSKKVGKLKPSTQPFMIGADPDDRAEPQQFFRGDIDEVRISKVARYGEDFMAPTSLAADKQTTALYRLNEGEGNVAHDTSGNKHHGKIHGVKWIK